MQNSASNSGNKGNKAFKLPVLDVKAAPSRGADTDLIAVYQDASKKVIAPEGPYLALVEKFRKADGFAARSGAVQFIPFSGSDVDHVLVVGFGSASELTEEKARVAGGHAFQKLLAEKSKAVVVHADTIFSGKGLDRDLTETRLVRAFAEGLLLGAYKFDKYRSKLKNDSSNSGNGAAKSAGSSKAGKSVAKGSAKIGAKNATLSAKGSFHGPESITFVTKDKVLIEQIALELAQVQAMAESIRVTRDWSNEPSNYGTPEYFANDAKRLAREHGLKCRVLTEADAAREKMGLFLAVGQGAEREGRIVIVEYTPKKFHKTIAFVGKGVTFDSGGISIKPSMRMEEMKHDMTGAATVMGAILLASQMKVQNRIVAIMAFTENMPSGNALQPGNVITSRAGKTVEVINTDAEGRLILADVLDYAQDLSPDAVIDVATLTGAVSIALGKICCGILGNDEGLIGAVRRAGDQNHERIWELPLFDEYFEDLRSDYADMKNSANDSYGGTIRGAIFLKQFIRKDTKWAHLDIAATAWNLNHLPYLPRRGASGTYVRTLAQFAADFA